VVKKGVVFLFCFVSGWIDGRVCGGGDNAVGGWTALIP